MVETPNCQGFSVQQFALVQWWFAENFTFGLVSLFQGRLTGVCGAVGSGKTSLISAILGQMHTLQGSCAVQGTFAYAAQEPWIFNATLQENILFGQPMDKERYQDAIEACCLKQDLEILTEGDMTEVGHLKNPCYGLVQQDTQNGARIDKSIQFSIGAAMSGGQ